jgi:hypothetical protein
MKQTVQRPGQLIKMIRVVAISRSGYGDGDGTRKLKWSIPKTRERKLEDTLPHRTLSGLNILVVKIRRAGQDCCILLHPDDVL